MNGLNPRRLGRHLALSAAGDFLLFNAALTASYRLRVAAPLSADVFLAYAPLFAVWLAGFYALGLYELRVVRDFVGLIGGLFGAALFCGVTGALYFYVFSPIFQESPKTILLLIIALSELGVFAWRRLWLWALDVHLLRQRLVFLGDDEQVRAIDAALAAESPDAGFVPMTWQAPGFDMVVADLPWVEAHWDAARVVLAHAVANHVPVVSLDVFYEALTGKVSPVWAARPAWAIEHVLPRAGSSYAFVKRGGDAIGAALLLLALAPLLAALYALIAAVDRVDPIYGQRRVGFLGREFVLWKFRTMRDGANADEPFRSSRQSARRVTRLGKLLRRFRLDELPQLWNVLRGEMSLVGPRPEWIKEVEILEKKVPNYHLRHLVPPGITGWAQVYYRATNDPKDSIVKHHYDLYYLKHFSLALDVGILLKTVKRVLVPDSRMRPSHAAPGGPGSLPGYDVGSIISRS
jgi:lipopolysaccharide/colanic/teichoic acid biosynthesis glycosyltransferase